MKSQISSRTIKLQQMSNRVIATYQGKSIKNANYELTLGLDKLFGTFKNTAKNERRPNQLRRKKKNETGITK